jgi:hypothetical protein
MTHNDVPFSQLIVREHLVRLTQRLELPRGIRVVRILIWMTNACLLVVGFFYLPRTGVRSYTEDVIELRVLHITAPLSASAATARLVIIVVVIPITTFFEHLRRLFFEVEVNLHLPRSRLVVPFLVVPLSGHCLWGVHYAPHYLRGTIHHAGSR